MRSRQVLGTPSTDPSAHTRSRQSGHQKAHTQLKQ